MWILLDTHDFLWYISADPQPPVGFRNAIRDLANKVYLNVASVWEALIKYALGKIPCRRPGESGMCLKLDSSFRQNESQCRKSCRCFSSHVIISSHRELTE